MPPTTPVAARCARRRIVAALLSLVVVASPAVINTVTASPAAAATPSQLATEMLSIINGIRKAHGIPALTMNSRLVRSATAHGVVMRQYNQVSTRIGTEPALATRMKNVGYSPKYSGETVGVGTGYSGLVRSQKAIYHTLSGKRAILSRNYTQIGIAVVLDHTRHKMWLAEDFGRPNPPAPALNVQYANSVLSLMNQQRAAHGRPALRMNSLLVRSAHAHNLTMARYNTMSHQLPGEAFFATRILSAGYNYLNAGENIGWNSLQTLSGVLDLQNIMYNEVPPDDGHRQNILNTAFKDVGIDIYFDSHNNKIWLTQDFGSIG